MNAVLSIERLSKRRADKPGDYLFRDMTANIEAGRRIAILGASGQGKSTLLRLLARLDAPDEGSIRLHGTAAPEWKPHEWRKKVCYVAQQPVMLPGTVEHNLRAVSELHGGPFDREQAEQCMAAVGLGALDWRKPSSELSGGEKQRTALVRSALLVPEALLLDEVTASLDPASKRAVELWLIDWASKRNTALVWVTHDMEQAKQISDSVWFMDEGRLLENGRTADFFRNPATERARLFIQSAQSGGEVGHV
ncbi:ATP-binding cassette domain-containing protein [Paenibacillus mesophilus]|uniref:ABC transporter ATP-binding protein n=1 Tax=Paenibacillus mesophilus TaxID=2582849 RepID=UPI00110F113B|nr:ATP-binding cassette domain-containing protein [Paenibacillus mesophilus]TMV50652.1 ATP-binding cassette domain-containing protein [Paenibacillus mesophilus]